MGFLKSLLDRIRGRRQGAVASVNDFARAVARGTLAEDREAEVASALADAGIDEREFQRKVDVVQKADALRARAAEIDILAEKASAARKEAAAFRERSIVSGLKTAEKITDLHRAAVRAGDEMNRAADAAVQLSGLEQADPELLEVKGGDNNLDDFRLSDLRRSTEFNAPGAPTRYVAASIVDKANIRRRAILFAMQLEADRRWAVELAEWFKTWKFFGQGNVATPTTAGPERPWIRWADALQVSISERNRLAETKDVPENFGSAVLQPPAFICDMPRHELPRLVARQ
jgi:hypothetical protein